MALDNIREAQQERPFRPFNIVAGDGTRYRVTSPEMLAIHPKATRSFVVYHAPEDYAILDAFRFSAIEVGKPPGRNGNEGDGHAGNGHSAKRK